MSKNSKRIPPALKHGIFSGLGLLPTESRVKFRKFRKQMFADLNLVGRLEQDIGEEIVCLEWRRQNLFTYELAKRAKQRHASIHAELNPPPPVPPHDPNFLRIEIPIDPDWVEPEPPSPQQLAARRKAANKQVELELGDAIALVKLGDIVTHEFLEKELAFRERLDAIITRLYKKLAYVRAIKSMSP